MESNEIISSMAMKKKYHHQRRNGMKRRGGKNNRAASAWHRARIAVARSMAYLARINICASITAYQA